ncbi:MAG: serine/threonine protein kinase [Gammaproteobacteria bacterium]|nr:serine/threonine protein kinase [Gammaproteobacteria bacterium]
MNNTSSSDAENDDNRGNYIDPDSSENDLCSVNSELEEHPYRLLTPDTIIEAVESTGRLSDVRIMPLNSFENRVYQVGMEEGDPVIVKFYRPDRWSPKQIDEEHRFSQYLYDLEIPVVPPLMINPDSDFPSLSKHSEFNFALYPKQGGRAPQLDNLEHLHQLGRFIGRIHAAGKSFPLQYRRKLNTTDFGSGCVEYLLSNHFIPQELQQAYTSVSDQLLIEIKANNPEASCYQQISLHGDCHAGNVLWRDERPHFVDFDDVITGPAIQDLWMLLSGDKYSRQKQLAEIIEGYETFMVFDLAELKLIEPLRAMRLLYYNAWLARRWHDPAFPLAFPWFNTPRYWSDHILECKEQLSNLREQPLTLPDL